MVCGFLSVDLRRLLGGFCFSIMLTGYVNWYHGEAYPTMDSENLTLSHYVVSSCCPRPFTFNNKTDPSLGLSQSVSLCPSLVDVLVTGTHLFVFSG